LSPEERRAQLLAAARVVFARLGYHHASVSDILDEAKVARGTFYNYFESKREVFGAVLADLMEEVAAVVVPIDVTGDVAQQLRDNLVRLVEAVAPEGVSRLLFTEAVNIDAEGDAALREFYDSAAQRIERALRVGRAMGIVEDGDLGIVAACLLGTLKEPVFLANLRGEPVDKDALAAELFRIIGRSVMRTD
jgi:AcrR family transcriptional regulator